jgi:threonine dehydrogenase-like Zn-dependent dehydrogenase
VEAIAVGVCGTDVEIVEGNYGSAPHGKTRTDHTWLAHLVTRREPPAEFKRALARQPDDVKVVIQFAEA